MDNSGTSIRRSSLSVMQLLVLAATSPILAPCSLSLCPSFTSKRSKWGMQGLVFCLHTPCQPPRGFLVPLYEFCFIFKYFTMFGLFLAHFKVFLVSTISTVLLLKHPSHALLNRLCRLPYSVLCLPYPLCHFVNRFPEIFWSKIVWIYFLPRHARPCTPQTAES